MKKYILFLSVLFLLFANRASPQCLVNSIKINTGYDPITGTAITPGANGAPAVIDPHWIITNISPAVATAIAATPIAGLVEVTPGNNADVIINLGSWTLNPAGNPGGWISCLNSDTYNDLGTGLPYNMTFGRTFRLCSDDSIKLSFYIADDNYMSATDIDGVPLLFSQPALALTTTYSTYTYFTQTVYLTAGTHIFHAVVNNYNVGSVTSNPTGLDLYGTVASATGLNSLVSESFTSCLTYSCSTTCNNTLSLPDTLHACTGTHDTLKAIVTGTDSILDINWTPATGLSSTTILDPVLTVGSIPGWYYVTVRSLQSYNLVANGNFSEGNTGFSSGYTYVSGPGSLEPESVYAVVDNPHDDHPGAASFYDHTTGTAAGLMMAINGASTPISVWCETIPVLPNTDYAFSSWFSNWSSDTTDNFPLIQFQINGTLLGTGPFSFAPTPGLWTKYYSTWNSGTSTTATICIYDEQTATSGNDFAIDDIAFQQICTLKDSIYIAPTIPDTTYAHTDTSVCAPVSTITLTAPVDSVYLWNTGATTSSINVTSNGTYWVYATGNCVTIVDTFYVAFKPLPVVNLGNDTGFCIGDSITLTSLQPAGNTYLWNTGSTTDSIHALTSGTYWLQVTQNGCQAADTINLIVSPHPVVDLGPDTVVCQGNAVTLQSSVAYTGAPIYLWNNASIAPSITATTSGLYWLQVSENGCAGADTVKVTFLNDTLTLYNQDVAICKGASVQVIATGNPAISYQWIPTAGIPVSNIITPLITPDTSAMYVLTASMAGCPDIVDSFYIDVQPTPLVYLGGNRQVCQYDTLHIVPAVTPQWYTHYSYSWSPATYLDNTDAASAVFTAIDTNIATIVLTVTTPAGCSGIDSAQIIIHPGNFGPDDTTIDLCPHDSVQLSPAAENLSYRWHPSIYVSDSNSSQPIVSPITTQAYSVIVTNEYGCLDTFHVNLIVHPSAAIYLGDSVTLSPGDSYQLSPQTNCTQFYWFPPGGLNDPYISNPIATPVVNTKYIVHGTTEWGCKTTDSISIYVDPAMTIALPNAFTPGAGVNNYLYIIKRGLVSLNYFRIFNRWGNKVYESKDIDAGWDGKYKGATQPFDVYVYEIEAVTTTGTVIHKQGNVTLIR